VSCRNNLRPASSGLDREVDQPTDVLVRSGLPSHVGCQMRSTLHEREVAGGARAADRCKLCCKLSIHNLVINRTRTGSQDRSRSATNSTEWQLLLGSIDRCLINRNVLDSLLSTQCEANTVPLREGLAVLALCRDPYSRSRGSARDDDSWGDARIREGSGVTYDVLGGHASGRTAVETVCMWSVLALGARGHNFRTLATSIKIIRRVPWRTHELPALLLRSDTTEPLACCDNGKSGTDPDCLAYFKLHNRQHLLLHDLHASQDVRQHSHVRLPHVRG